MDVPDRGRKKSVRRKSNMSDRHNKDSVHVGAPRRMKKVQSSLRSSKKKNGATDRSRRLTDYFYSKGGTEVPHRPNCGASRSHIPNVSPNPADGMPNVQSRIPQLHIPRMRDLLSTQLGFLSGRPLQAFLQMFDQFDLTLSENTRAIQASLCNIVRAPFHLAEQCRPVIDEIIAAQRSTDPNIVGEPSSRNNRIDEDDTANAFNATEHGHHTNDVNRDNNSQNILPTVIQFGTTPLSGAIVAQSFADSTLVVDPIFMNGFVKCLSYDDYYIRPECHGYRILLDADVSATLNVEWDQRYSSAPKYNESDALAAIGRCLPFTNLKKAKLILLPVLHRHHWSVYCINLGQSRIDVLDSMEYESHGDNDWDSYHSHMGKTIMQRLSDALSKAAPRKFASFRNWRHVKVNVPVHKSHYDSAFFAMKFLEFYDGDGHGSLKADIATDRPKEQCAEMLYYLTFHSENKLHPLPEAHQFRISDHHPFFY
ncbi:unnamed protein product [Urochloa decumbens]|uniref:Ubiquitin-like protease family profile domain-containing protein n=1 Tax=Urochloa decumbens TaxID=240449 RepID=A0ABC9D6M9_9POAL